MHLQMQSQAAHVPKIISGLNSAAATQSSLSGVVHTHTLSPCALDKFLHDHSRRRHAIIGDGNCLFRSFSFILVGTEENHQSVRASIVDVIEKNPKPFAPLCHPSTVVKHNIIDKMKKNYTWGTDVEIFALSALLCKPIYVAVQGSKQYYWAKYMLGTTTVPANNLPWQVFQNNHLEICHVNSNHYDVCVTSDGQLPGTAPCNSKSTNGEQIEIC